MHIHWSKQEAIWSEDLPAAPPHQNSTILQTATSISVKLCYMTDTFLVKTFIAVFCWESFLCKTIPREWNVGTACPGAKATKHETASDESSSAWSGEHLFSAWFQLFACFQTCAICQCRLCEGRCQYHTSKMQGLQNSSIFQLWPIPPLWQLVTMPNNATHMLLCIFPNETIGAESSKTPHSAQIS